jgi:hypothetical protein
MNCWKNKNIIGTSEYEGKEERTEKERKRKNEGK